jgi:hypothetical protein
MNVRLTLASSGLLLAAIAGACSSPSEHGESTEQSASALVTCTAHDIRVVDLHADFRDIWAGRETVETGKQSDPLAPVVADFGATVVPAQVSAVFVPV